jgi:uroporphyrinogen III methyltransferase / synthase
MTKGKVYLVGAGPGDPGLITVKGMRCIETADVLIYDYLASPALLSFAPPGVDLIYVGKKEGTHTLPQEQINRLIVEKALEGNIVTRLKGGDPFVFGRGGEEAEALTAHGISFEIVPGVTSAIAAAAYAGIPVTHRGLTSTLAFVTGHENPAKETSNIDWQSLARGIGTLIFFMGVKNLPHIVRQLTTHGKPSSTPVALGRWGTTPRQQTVIGTLETIVQEVKAAGLKAPAIIIVGEVVSLRPSLKWFEGRPLMGKTIVVTRAREQASDLVSRLSDLGADCFECPTIKVMPPEDVAPLDRAIRNISTYHWLIFTSVNAVSAFFERLFALGNDARALGHIRTAAIGPATADKLLAYGIGSDIVPENYQGESVAVAFAGEDVRGKHILLPRAEEARPVIPRELSKMGALVKEVTVYRTLQDRRNVDQLMDLLKERRTDMITFTSSSTAKNFKALFTPDDFKTLTADVPVAAIGPVTADTATALGMKVALTAESYTIPGLCDAILNYYRSE